MRGSGASRRIAKAHRFAPVIAHINENLRGPIEAAELYRLAGLSHSRFSEQFRAAFGVQPDALHPDAAPASARGGCCAPPT